MSYQGYLEALLRPLGVYDWDGGVFHKAELASEGRALDGCARQLENIEKEMLLTTAEKEGLEAVERLLPYRPVAGTLERRRAALAALLRIGGDGFTLSAINDNLAGCGLNAKAAETDNPGQICISFPEVPGIPDGYDEMRRIIEDIVPCHLGIEYVFWYITWTEMELRFPTWAGLDNTRYEWKMLEEMVK